MTIQDMRGRTTNPNSVPSLVLSVLRGSGFARDIDEIAECLKEKTGKEYGRREISDAASRLKKRGHIEWISCGFYRYVGANDE